MHQQLLTTFCSAIFVVEYISAITSHHVKCMDKKHVFQMKEPEGKEDRGKASKDAKGHELGN